jgi:hypothetical protein
MPTSALGHKRTFERVAVMFALPPKADMCGATWDVRFGPKAGSCAAAFSDLELSLGPRLLSDDASKGGRMIWDAGPEKALTSIGCRDRGRHAGGGTRLSPEKPWSAISSDRPGRK